MPARQRRRFLAIAFVASWAVPLLTMLVLAPASSAAAVPPPALAAAATLGQIPASGHGPLVCPAGNPAFESRGWWTPSSDSIDQYRGVDAEICAPRRLTGQVPVLLHIQLRRNHATINLLRVQIYGSWGGASMVEVHNPTSNGLPLRGDPVTGDGEWYVPVTLNSTVSPHDGWQEIRVTANIDNDEFGRRQYESTGIQSYVANNKSVQSSYRPMPFWEARGWYELVEYENIRVLQDPPAGPVSGTYSVRWRAAAGSGGKPVTYHAAYVDANTHAIPMVLPIVYDAGAGGFDGTTRIDTTKLANGVHKLVLRADAKTTTPAGTTSVILQWLFSVDNGGPVATPTPVPPTPTPTAVMTPAPTPVPTPVLTPSPLPSTCGA